MKSSLISLPVMVTSQSALLPFQPAATTTTTTAAASLLLILFVTSWTSDVTNAAADYLCGLSPEEEEQLRSVTRQLLNATITRADHHDTGGAAVGRNRKRRRRSVRRRSLPEEEEDSGEVDRSVCHFNPYHNQQQQQSISGIPATVPINQLSSCPWHYEELPTTTTQPSGPGTGSSSSSSSSSSSYPGVLLQARLTCGAHCLMTAPDGRSRVPGSYPCLPVTRTVSVLHCTSSANTAAADGDGDGVVGGGSGSGGGGGERCCRSELKAVTVAFTCAFPSL
ncbi:uncharacterized protein LOC143274979 [Babylonia areolata]|uniref:uncharacterized protein LOC143274979 n=1 Tax=Babylonia areolata TaxID=304850 RepID=UPI003FD27296